MLIKRRYLCNKNQFLNRLVTNFRVEIKKTNMTIDGVKIKYYLNVEKVLESIEKTQEKNNIHNMSEDCLYSGDFIQLGNFFFGKYSLSNNFQHLVEELNKNDKNMDLDSVIDKYKSKSNYYVLKLIDLMNSDVVVPGRLAI